MNTPSFTLSQDQFELYVGSMELITFLQMTCDQQNQTIEDLMKKNQQNLLSIKVLLELLAKEQLKNKHQAMAIVGPAAIGAASSS